MCVSWCLVVSLPGPLWFILAPLDVVVTCPCLFLPVALWVPVCSLLYCCCLCLCLCLCEFVCLNGAASLSCRLLWPPVVYFSTWDAVLCLCMLYLCFVSLCCPGVYLCCALSHVSSAVIYFGTWYVGLYLCVCTCVCFTCVCCVGVLSLLCRFLLCFLAYLFAVACTCNAVVTCICV